MPVRRAELVPPVAGVVIGALLVAVALPLTVEGQRGAPDAASPTPAATDAADSSGRQLAGPSGEASALRDLPAAAGRSGAGAGSGGNSQAPSAGNAASALEASDRGVTPTTIKVGFLLLEVAGTSQIGFGFAGIDPAQQRRAFQAYVDDVNRRGISGRTIEPVYRAFDVTNPDDLHAKCAELTQDEKVFAVIAQSGYTGPPVLCVTVQHETPLVTPGTGITTEYIERSRGRLVIFLMASHRLMANLAHELHQSGVLTGKKIGIVDDADGTELATDAVLVPRLRSYGHEVVHTSRLSANLSTAAGQVPVEVQQMRSKGVQLVILLTNTVTGTQFVQAADAQRWRPTWVASDWKGGSADSIAQNMPASYDGAVAVTQTRTGEWRDGVDEPAPDTTCREIYERATNDRLPRSTDGETYNGEYETTQRGCNLVRLFEAAARLAGADLTRASFGSAVQRLGEFPSALLLGASFGPGKFDAPDAQRMLRFQYACRCWKVASPPRRSPY